MTKKSELKGRRHRAWRRQTVYGTLEEIRVLAKSLKIKPFHVFLENGRAGLVVSGKRARLCDFPIGTIDDVPAIPV